MNSRVGEESVSRRGRCKIRVRVTDINDNPPQFLKSVYYATVQVDAVAGTIVKQVRLKFTNLLIAAGNKDYLLRFIARS